jgi:hypothetical protein
MMSKSSLPARRGICKRRMELIKPERESVFRNHGFVSARLQCLSDQNGAVVPPGSDSCRVAVLLPFLPVLLFEVPLCLILSDLAKLLL